MTFNTFANDKGKHEEEENDEKAPDFFSIVE